MYNTQSFSHRCGNQYDGRGREHYAARRAAKRAKFEQWMNAKMETKNHFRGGHSVPPVNVLEKDDRYELHLFAPGLNKDAFDISLTEDVLTIVGKVNSKENEGDAKWQRQELKFEDFERKFELNDKINSEEITADYLEGILLVTLMKKEGKETVRRAVSVG